VETEGRPVSWVPHFTSVINWTLRVGLGLLRQVAPITQRWVAIIDHSIDVGTKKALVVLRIPLAALSQRGAAIQLRDCQCVGLTIADTVNGETLAAPEGPWSAPHSLRLVPTVPRGNAYRSLLPCRPTERRVSPTHATRQ